MRRLRYSVAMSLDGYIAGPKGEYDWIVNDPENDLGAKFREFDTLLMGRKTYELVQAQSKNKGMGMRVVVVSGTLNPARHPQVEVITGNIAASVAALKAEPGKDIWLFGGGGLLRTLASVGLMDSIELAIVPVLLGGGVPVIAPGGNCKLRLRDQRALARSGILLVNYDVVNAPAAG